MRSVDDRLAPGRYHGTMQDMSDIVEQMKSRFDLRVHRWRKTMSGCAWRTWYIDGRVINWIETQATPDLRAVG